MILTDSFEWTSIAPIVVMLVVASIIPVVLSILKINFIPVLVFEIVIGMILSNIPYFRNIFTNNGNLNILTEGLYTMGLAMTLFLSGMETDFSVFKRKKKGNHYTLPILKLSWILVILVILTSLGASFIFKDYIIDDTNWKVIVGIIALTIFFSSTFASLVVPIVHDEKLEKSTIGQIICTYATIMEFISIVALSALMIVLQISEDAKPWLLLVIVVILLICYLIVHFIPRKIFTRFMNGIVHLDLRLIILGILLFGILAQISGAEFILGTFLFGAVIKSAGIKEETEHKISSLGYGLLIPIFYILVGFQVGLMMPFNDLLTTNNLLLIGLVFLAMVVTKIPFIILFKWYKLSTIIPTILLTTSTIIVGIACNHFGVINGELASAIIIASVISCLIPPILFDTNKTYGYARKKYHQIIIDPNEVTYETKN